jgi:hypothetical protein
MADYQNQNHKIVPRSGGFFQDLTNRFRLVGRLIMDPRVNPFLKILPFGTLIYVFSPIDLLSLNPLDDAFIIWAGTTLFVELCPPEVIEEHMQALNRIMKGQWKDFRAAAPEVEVVEGEFYEVDPGGRRQSTNR